MAGTVRQILALHVYVGHALAMQLQYVSDLALVMMQAQQCVDQWQARIIRPKVSSQLGKYVLIGCMADPKPNQAPLSKDSTAAF